MVGSRRRSVGRLLRRARVGGVRTDTGGLRLGTDTKAEYSELCRMPALRMLVCEWRPFTPVLNRDVQGCCAEPKVMAINTLRVVAGAGASVVGGAAQRGDASVARRARGTGTEPQF